METREPGPASALRRLLGDECHVVAEASNGSALVDAIQLHQPDVVVTDIAMPRL